MELAVGRYHLHHSKKRKMPIIMTSTKVVQEREQYLAPNSQPN